jgi:Protein of unknown function (DUF2637)
MSSYPPGRGPRPADPYPGLRLAALIAVILGVVLLAAAAFALSYAGIHEIALRAGVSSGLARLYPVIFDAMVVVSGAAALALRGASWWARAYAWSSLLLMLAVVATADALHATNVSLPAQPTRAVVAVTPWVLLLIAFGLWLEMLRHFRRVRAASALQARMAGPTAAAAPALAASGPGAAGQAEQPGQAANGETGDPAAGNGGSATAQRAAVTWAGAGDVGVGRSLPQPREGLDLILGPREENPPAMTVPGTGTDAAAAYQGEAGQREPGHGPDQVSYGEETGYVHPESFRDQGGYAGFLGHGEYGGWVTQPPVPLPAEGIAPPQAEGTAPLPAEGTAPPQAGDTAPPQAEGTAPPQAEGTAPPQAEGTAPPQAEGTAPPQAGDAAEPTPAADQDAPGPDGDAAAQTPAPSPTLDRLHSTPAPPED